MSAVRARADRPMAPSRGPGRRLAGTKPRPPGRPCAPLTVQYRSRPPGARRHPSGWRLSIIDPQARRSASANGSSRTPPGASEAHPTGAPPGSSTAGRPLDDAKRGAASGSVRPGSSASGGRTRIPVTVDGLPSWVSQPSRPPSPRARPERVMPPRRHSFPSHSTVAGEICLRVCSIS